MTIQVSPSKDYFPCHLQISARAWYDLDLSVEELTRPGRGSQYALQWLAERLRRRTLTTALSAGRLMQLSLLNRVFRVVANRYLSVRDVRVEPEGLQLGGQTQPLPTLLPLLQSFVDCYPPLVVYEGFPAGNFLREPPQRQATLTELFILAVQTLNPAAESFRPLFEDSELAKRHPYRKILGEIDSLLQDSPAPPALRPPLLELLLAPLRACPDSLDGQLRFMQKSWADILPEDLLREILIAFDVVAAEEQMRGHGPGGSIAPGLGGLDDQYEEPERFSPDADWMANAVLIAKSIYVWLDQLSAKYQRPITRLNEIPDQELDTLARRGFNALWLIGIWERSPASQRIKQIMGNPEAVASAYSLYDYVIASDLGGEAARDDLHHRCQQRGIRLACDVVPNHTGIYSKWVKEHPDWFVQLDHPPFPAYNYTGPNLSFDYDQEIQIDNGYWDHRDAAVVFRHRDCHSGRVRYIYHGNDGTHMPWNDTAQLNFLLPEVREAMIQTILHVARTFKVIRFDAAMTLAKKHYQRLWFPQPGGGAGVPSRADHWMTREEFDQAFPVEFWREVVDRVAAEAPDTLLLAEAFWLMEGYFVRTLGMHRVYNSAFMNMLKMEDNGKYRSVIKNVIEFNPEILKRFVNFMNNPDEATAVEQFGKEDKYFGVAVLLATMPGLPMFGHGQIEGFREKYGMEYRRAYWNEVEDEGFIRHHENQIFPLLRKRYLFSGSDQFALYDFISNGFANEDVFAYSNGAGDERVLVVYHNRFSDTGGWIQHSTPKAIPGQPEGSMHCTTLATALNMRDDERIYYRFREHRSGLEYLRTGREMVHQGLYLQLGAYQYNVFWDFREIYDADGSWRQLCEHLDGRAVPDLEAERRRLHYAKERGTWQRLLQRARHLHLAPAQREVSTPALARESMLFLDQDLETVVKAALQFRNQAGTADEVVNGVSEEIRLLPDFSALLPADPDSPPSLRELPVGPAEDAPLRSEEWYSIIFPLIVSDHLGRQTKGSQPVDPLNWYREFLLRECSAAPPANGSETVDIALLPLLVHFRSLVEQDGSTPFRQLLEEPVTQRYLQVHWYERQRYVRQEKLESLIFWCLFSTLRNLSQQTDMSAEDLAAVVASCYGEAREILTIAADQGYRFDPLLDTLPVREKNSRETE